jgi:hypothetical protein
MSRRRPGAGDEAEEAPAWHLPGLRASPREEWHAGETPTGRGFRAPSLTRADADRIAESVQSSALRARRERSVDDVARAAGEAALALADPTTAEGRRARALLGEELGWPEPMAAETLERMARGWSPTALRRLLRRELGDAALLDRFVPDEDGFDSPERASGAARREEGALRRSRTAAGPPLLLQVQSGNLPGVGIAGILRGLLVRSGMLVKTSRGKPGLAAEFARSLARRDPLLGRSLAVTWWPGGERPPAARSWTKRAGKVIVYGGDEAVTGVRSMLPPGADLVAYGPKVGVVVVLEDAAGAPGVAEALARDVCAYEQRGCVSPRLAFTVGEERREALAEELAGALGSIVKDTGRARIAPAEASAIRGLRSEVELGAHGQDARVMGPVDDVGWTVITGSRPRIETRALPRVVRVYSAPDLKAWGRLLQPLRGRIQAVGYAGESGRAQLAREAALLGACRVAPVGRIAWPPVDWLHDGRRQLLPLLRWTELEEPP